MTAGILLGFGAALAQSTAYLLSRVFLGREGRQAGGLLLVVSHVIMGGFSLVLLPLVVPMGFDWRRFDLLINAAAIAGFYLSGQFALFQALRTADASKIVPMLGLKILFLALFGMAFQGQTLSVTGWLAVLLAVGGVFMVNHSDGRLPRKALLIVMCAVVGYSFSDLSIVRMTSRLGTDGWRGIAFTAAMAYLMCGLGMSLLLPIYPAVRRRRVWRAALPYSLCWYMAMLLLFACFARIGAVFGNIVQSSRGLISIGLGVAVARAGLTELERRLTPGMLLRRMAGAAAITAAIILFVLADA